MVEDRSASKEMKRNWRPWVAWILAVLALALLAVASFLLFVSAPWKTDVEQGAFWLDALANMGAPLLGLMIALRQPKNRYGWLWLVFGIMSGALALALGVFNIYGSQPSGYPLPITLLLWSFGPATSISLLCWLPLILWFPTGQPPTRHWRFLEWWLVIDLLLFLPGAFVVGETSHSTVVIENPFGFIPADIAAVPVAIGFLSLNLAIVLAAASVLFRYRRAGIVERQQIKWFIAGGAGLASTFVLFIVLNPNGMSWKIYSDAMLLLVYGTIGIAILRYRLYDIDIIIRRTLIYAVLTGLLALVYFGSVILLQQFFRLITGQASELAIIVSTLAIAALFNPLRRRVQVTIDHRFYRRKYDAQEVLAAFGATARDEVDLGKLTDELVEVVSETMQPASTSLWLKASPPRVTRFEEGR